MISIVNNLRTFANPPQAAPARPSAQPAGDKLDIDWSGNRPAHRGVKRLVRGAAMGIAAAGVGKLAFDVITSPSIEVGLIKASLSLAGTAAAIVGLDLVSGVGHHFGDNYGPKHSFNHTRWHTDVQSTGYCLVGVSNKALDKVGFWPKWEKLIYNVSGKKPISWDVPDYAGFISGGIDQKTLHERQVANGMIK